MDCKEFYEIESDLFHDRGSHATDVFARFCHARLVMIYEACECRDYMSIVTENDCPIKVRIVTV